MKFNYLNSRPLGYCYRVIIENMYQSTSSSLMDIGIYNLGIKLMDRYLLHTIRNQIQLHNMTTGLGTTE